MPVLQSSRFFTMHRIQAARILSRGVSATAPRNRAVYAMQVIPPSTWKLAFTTSSRQYAGVTIKVPPMAESINEGTISQIHKFVGDHVEADEEVVTIETDKIDVSVNASERGVITKILVQEGSTVSVGQDLILIEPGETSSIHATKESPKRPEAPKEQEISSPQAQSVETTKPNPSPSASPVSAPPKRQIQALEPTKPATQSSISRPGRNERRVRPLPSEKVTSPNVSE